MIKKAFVFIIPLVVLWGCLPVVGQSKSYPTLTDDGAWCWFSDPRAIFVDKNHILTGWVKSDGTVETARLNLASGQSTLHKAYPTLEVDDHNNPAFVKLQNGGYMTFYSKHVKKYLYYHHQGKDSLFGPVQVFDPVGKEELKKFPLRQVTYANPYQLSKENGRIYCFGRWTGYKPNMMWSDDGGQHFNTSRVFIAEQGFRKDNRPYVKYYSDGQSRIHMTFTDGHPRKEKTNSVYYAYYEKGAFWRADGTKICEMADIPFRPSQATLVYKATESTGRAWVQDIAVSQKGRIAILYARYPQENNHIYHHVQYDRGQWTDTKICEAGPWFPQTPKGQREREPHYSGGMVLNPANFKEVFVSQQVNGTFEIIRYDAKDKPMEWLAHPVTENSKYDQVRPYVPRSMKKPRKNVVLWMENERYVHYTDFKSRIKYQVF